MANYTINNIAGDIDFECNNNPLERTLQNAKNLLMLRKGELPYDRQRGLDPAIFDLTINDINSVLMTEVSRVLLWEPDVEAVSAVAEITEEGQVIITVEISTDIDEEVS